jgi:hypothetical protein
VQRAARGVEAIFLHSIPNLAILRLGISAKPYFHNYEKVIGNPGDLLTSVCFRAEFHRAGR